MSLKIGALFAGYGGLDMGVQQALGGGELAWYAEVDPAPAKILAHHWPDVPNLGDVTAVDWSAVEPVDVITGGSPCQDLSHAGKRLGMRAGTRSGLWASMCDAIDALRPSIVVWENVRGALSAPADSAVEPCPICLGDGERVTLRALGRVLGDLAELGYDAAWCGLRAADVGAPHGRFRVFVVAHPADARLRTRHGEWARPEPWQGGPGDEQTSNLLLLPTPRARDHKGRDPNPNGVDLNEAVALLPTPTVSDMGAGKTVEEWDDWAARMRAKHGNGNGHGKSLSIEVQRLLPTPTTTDAKGARNSTANRRPDSTGNIGDTLGDVAYRDEFGQYAPAIARWERVLGRPAPAPTKPDGRGGAHRLAPEFVEWMMGLPQHHVTNPAIGLTRAQQLKALGNGVVPQQAAAAVSLLLAHERMEVAA